MSYTLEVQPDPPVIVVTYEGTIDASELGEAQQAIAQTAQKMGMNRVFCIQDIRKSRISFLDGMTNLKEFMFAQRKNRSADVQVRIIFVGMDSVGKAFMQMMPMAPKGRYRVGAVDTMDEAMEMVRRELVP